MNTHLIYILAAAVAAIASLFIGYGMGKASKTTLVGSQFGIWLGGILSAFIGGCAKGAPVGSTTGSLLALKTGSIHADLTIRHLAVEAMFLLAGPVLTGITKVDNYIEANPMPNLFTGKPSIPGTTPEPPNPILNKKPNESTNPPPQPAPDPVSPPAAS